MFNSSCDVTYVLSFLNLRGIYIGSSCSHSLHKSNNRSHLLNLYTKSFLFWSKSDHNLLLLYMKCSASYVMLVKDKSVSPLSFDQNFFKCLSIFSIISRVTLSIISGIHLVIFSRIIFSTCFKLFRCFYYFTPKRLVIYWYIL